jgi:opacity protein-like surface antigen
MKKTLLAFVLAFASLGAAEAQTYVQVPDLATRPLRFVAGAGATFGGDELVTTHYENGHEATLRAGAGLALLAGVDYRFNPQFSAQATVGYHIDMNNGSNGDATFERVPFELIGYYHVNDKVRVGGGLRYVTGTTLSSSGVGSFGDYDFKDTTSALAELEYMATPRIGVKLRYVNEQFKEKETNIGEKGDHVGLLVNFYF